MKKILAAISVCHTCRAIMRQDPSEEVRYSVMGQALADIRKVLCLQSCIFFFLFTLKVTFSKFTPGAEHNI